ncbi:MAG: MFS transporter [Hyphomicrobiales bacterium]
MSASTAPGNKPLWIIIACAALAIGLGMGIRQTFGLFLEPVSQDIGLGREVFALSMGLQNLLWGISAPFFGAFADKYGAGRVVLAGGVLYAAGLVMLAASAGGGQVVASGLLLGLGVSGLGFTAVLGAVGRAAPPEKRSGALGMASAGGSFGQFAALPYAHVFLESAGWSMTLLLLAVLTVLAVPAAWGVSGKPQSAAGASTQTVSHAFREAMTHKGFLLLTAGFFVCGFHVTFVATHLPAFLGDRSFEPWLGAAALSLIGLANVAGTYICGRAGQVMEKRKALSYLYLGRAVVFLGFLFIPLTEFTVLALSMAIGLLWLGTIPLTSGLIATLFGPKWMSMLFGLVFFAHQIGGFLGAWLGGYVFDALRSYDAMWWMSSGLGVWAALLHWPIVEKPVARLSAGQA